MSLVKTMNQQGLFGDKKREGRCSVVHFGKCLYESKRIGHVRYINILTGLRGFRVKIVSFLSFFCLSIPKRGLDTKKATPKIEV